MHILLTRTLIIVNEELFILRHFLRIQGILYLVIFTMLGVSFFAHAVNISIEGLDDDKIEKNISLHLNSVTAPESSYELKSFRKSVVEKTNEAIQVFGFYNADINFLAPRIDPDTWTLNIVLNSPVKVGSVVVNMTKDVELSARIKQSLASLFALKDKRFSHVEYETIKQGVINDTVIQGYFDFKFQQTKVSIEQSSNTANIYWDIDFGTRYGMGPILFSNETKGKDIILSLQNYQEGDPYSQSLIAAFSQDIKTTDYFSSVIVRPVIDRANDGKVPIEIIVTDKPRDTYNFGVGASTDTGPRFTASWERPWVNSRGHGIGADLYLSAELQSISANYNIPMANPLNDFFNIQIGFKNTIENDVNSETITLALQRQFGAEEKGDWDKIAFLKFEQETFIQSGGESNTTRLVLPGITFNRLRKKGALHVISGDRQSLTVEGASDSLGSDINLTKITARTKWIRTYGKHRLIARADVGAISTNDFLSVPSTIRFFAGGDQSVRGFGLNELSPKDENNIDIGAKYLAVLSTEYAYEVADGWRAAGFIDSGSAAEQFADKLAYGIGGGLHWLSPIGTVRVYVARGFNDIERTWRLHLVIGPGV